MTVVSLYSTESRVFDPCERSHIQLLCPHHNAFNLACRPSACALQEVLGVLNGGSARNLADMKSGVETEFRPGRLSVKEYQLRSALCTSQQVAELKSSSDFARWSESQRHRKQRRHQARALLQCVLAVSLLLLGYSLAKPKVSSSGVGQLCLFLPRNLSAICPIIRLAVSQYLMLCLPFPGSSFTRCPSDFLSASEHTP